MDLLPPMSDGLVAGLVAAAMGASTAAFFLCCSDCLSFIQAAESFALGRMFALAEQAAFDALSVVGPALAGAVFGALGGAAGGLSTGAQR